MLGMHKGQVKRSIYVFIILVLMVSYLVAFGSNSDGPPKPFSSDVYIGVDATFGSVEDMKAIIDQVKAYTNFFVVGSTAMTNDLNNITEVSQYLNDSGLQFLIYSHPAVDLPFSQIQWVAEARQNWNASFHGLYAYDEPGGHQIDHDYTYMCAQEAANYSDAANLYVKNLTWFLSGVKDGWEIGDFPMFTSDYALHEYDYRAGYDVILTEFGWNLSRPLNIALARGAATLHGKDWGVMITGNVTDGNFESGPQMYDDMVLAYQNGAKYILVFDYPSLAAGILKQEHFDALKQFWQYVQNHPRNSSKASDRLAYVLPKDYGYGLRSSVDKVWGLWEADNASVQIWNDANRLSQQYGSHLDIVYEDSLPSNGSVYNRLVFWDGTIEASAGS
jgi:hypothetical protein